MSYQYSSNRLGGLTPVVKNLLIINILLFVITYVYDYFFHVDLVHLLGLHYWKSPAFRPYQVITYMFMHGGLMHIAFNMFALFSFGNILEKVWGGKRFLIFYMITGIGAAAAQLLVAHFRLQSLYEQITPDNLAMVFSEGNNVLMGGQNYADPAMGLFNELLNVPTVGASGAIFGILVAFGMLFPNTELILLFFPVPVKAKYAVIGYGVLELFLGAANFSGDDVAHFAHLGGALFGFILVKYWQRNNKHFY